jgi:hypothetical protein
MIWLMSNNQPKHPLSDPVAHVLEYMHVLKQHWPTFAAVAGICIVGTWFVSGFFSSQQIEILKNHNVFLQDRLTVLQQNQAASASSPPSLWRRLGDRERGLLLAALKQPHQQPGVLIIYAMADSEPRQYAAQFLDVFRSSGVDVRAREVSLSMGTADVGIMVGLGNFPTPSDEAKKFKDLLTSAGLEVHYTAWTKMPGIDDAPVDFDLFIGPKPW